MKAHLKNIEGVMPIINQLKGLCREDVKKVSVLSTFIEVEIITGLESSVSALFSEDGYDTGDYRIVVYKRKEHENEVNIPLKFIDCIFGL